MNQDQPPPSDPGRQPGNSDYVHTHLPTAHPIYAGAEIPVARPLSPEQPVDSSPMLLERVSPWVCVFNLIAVVPAFMLSGLIVSLVSGIPDGIASDDPAATIDVLDVVPVGLLTCVILMIVLRLERVPLSAIGLTMRGAGINVLLGFAAAVVAFGAFAISVAAMNVLWPDGAKQFNENVDHIDRMIPKVPPLTLLGVMACVAAYEEFIFRGILLTHLRRILHSWTAAVLIGGIVFGLIHIIGDVHQVEASAVPLGLTAIAWSVFTIWRRSLAPAVIGHTLFNFVQVLILYQWGSQPDPTSQPAAGLGLARLGRMLASVLGIC